MKVFYGAVLLLHPMVILASALSVLLFAGCGSSPLKISQMKQVITTTMSVATDDGRELKPVSIEGGLHASLGRAVQPNEAYRAMIAMEAEAVANIAAADSVRKTQVSTNANIGSLSESGTGGATTGVAGGLSLSRVLYDAGESAATVDQASAQALATQADRQIRGNEIALDIARAWIDVWQYGARIALLNSRTAEFDTLVEQIERMASNGMIDRATLESVRRRIVDISLEAVRIEESLQEAQARFLRYFDISPTTLVRPSEILGAVQVHDIAKSWQKAPALRRQAAELVMARNNVIIAAAAFQPRGVIQGGFSSPMERGSSAVATLGVSLTYTIGDGGRREASLRSAQARLDAAQAQLADAQRRIEAEIGAATTRLTAIERSMPLIAENIRLSAAEAEIARTQIVTGQSNLQMLIESEIGNYRARDSEIAMQAEELTLQLTIAALTGVLGRELGLEKAATE